MRWVVLGLPGGFVPGPGWCLQTCFPRQDLAKFPARVMGLSALTACVTVSSSTPRPYVFLSECTHHTHHALSLPPELAKPRCGEPLG